MKRKKRAEMVRSGWIFTCLCLLWGCIAVVGGHGVRKKGVKDPTAGGKLGHPQWTADSPLFQEVGGSDGETVPARHLLSTNETTAAPPEKDKSIWEEIDEFYSDDNNMAMYCVLPLIILVYGGCSAIYCVYKCRRYLRRRGRHKRLRNEDTGSVSGDDKNDLNQLDSEGQPVKTISGNTWEDDSYNVQRKKTPLPWDTPQKSNNQSRDGNYSAGSRDSTSIALEREREKLDRTLERPPETGQPPASELKPTPQPQPRPIEIVPISQKEYQRHMEANGGGLWDPLHNRPFESRASGTETARSRQGRESSWSIRDEIMAKYDALTSLAMAKKTANALRSGSQDPNMDMGHRPDTLKRKPGKKKLIFIAE